MSQKSVAQLKALWITGFIPTQSDFADFFDSFDPLNSVTMETLFENYLICTYTALLSYMDWFKCWIKNLTFGVLKTPATLTANFYFLCDMPLLVSVVTSVVNWIVVSGFTKYVYVKNLPLLETLDLSQFTLSATGPAGALIFSVDNCPLLTDLTIPVFAGNANGGVVIDGITTPLLSSLIIPNYTKFFSLASAGTALDVISVDAILAGCDAAGLNGGFLNLSGGTNAAPSGGAQNPNLVSLLAKMWGIMVNP